MDQSKKINVFIADDHEFVIHGFSSYINSHSDLNLIDTALTIIEAKEKIKNLASKIDVIILDYSFGDGYGEEILSFIKENNINAKIIFLSMHEELALIHSMLKKGANSFVLKTDPAAVIIEAIYAVHHEGHYLNPKLSKKLYNFSNSLLDDEISSITNREKEILKLFIKCKTSNEIAEELFISLSTVETHKKNIYKKFKVTNSAALMKAVIQYNHFL